MGDTSTNRRKFKRVVFNEPIKASIEIVVPYTDSIQTIAVLDMSAGGLKFVSQFEFTNNFISIYRITMKLNDKETTLFGKIIRKRKLLDNFFEFSFMFVFDYDQENSLTVYTPNS